MRYLTLLMLCSCAGFTPGQYADFWDQRVSVTAWGIYYVSPYGPVGVGYAEWARNQLPRTELPKITNPVIP